MPDSSVDIVSDNLVRVGMTVINNGFDVRVIKEAASLKTCGYNVRIFARFTKVEPATDVFDGVTIERVRPISDASTLWYYWRNTSMPLTFSERRKLLSTFACWTLNNYSIGYVMKEEFDYSIFSNERSAAKRATIDPWRAIESGVANLALNLSSAEPMSFKARVSKVWQRFLGKPENLYIKNEHLLFALAFYDTVVRFNPKIIHCHDLYTLRTGRKIKRALSNKLVYDAHEYERDRVRDYPQWRKKLGAREEAQQISNADATITVSDSIADRIADHYDIQKPTVIFNTSFADAETLAKGQKTYASLRSVVGLNPATPLAVHIGKLFNMHNQTGQFREMITALTVVPNYHLALLGPYRPEAKKQVHEWAQRFGVEKRVHVIQPVPYQYVPSFVSDATVGIVAMHGDNLNTEYAMPNKLFEQALAGLPLIVSDQKEIRNFVHNEAKGLVIDCNNPAEIAQAMKEIADNPQAYEYKPEQMERIRSEYDWYAQEKKLRELYATLYKPNVEQNLSQEA